jgi:hypothetical protein
MDSDHSTDCSLHAELFSIKTSLQEVLRCLAESQSDQASLCKRVAQLEGKNDKRSSSGGSDCRWICPVCWKPFAHRESFKGHIRRLTESPSEHMHCYLDPGKPEHVALLSHSRYGDGDFLSRAAAFSAQLYQTVKSNSNSTRTSASSHSAVCHVILLLVAVCGCDDWELHVSLMDASDYGLARSRCGS